MENNDLGRLPAAPGAREPSPQEAVSAVPASPPSAVWLVWASEGEYSDRSEWPVVAAVDEETAQTLVKRLTQLWRSAKVKWKRVEPQWYDKAVEDAFWEGDDDAREYARLTGNDRHGLGGFDEDERFFTCCRVELLTASAMSARSGETAGLAPQAASAVPQADAQPINHND